VRARLGQVERVEPEWLRLAVRQDLHLQRPALTIPTLDRVEEVPLVVVRVSACDLVRLGLGQELDPLIG
jgi:hypothetical protein